ncbi:MAG: CBS domain-containing protein [Actinomycetota bacterium]
MLGKLFNRFTVGAAAGFLLGARAGRGTYDQIMGWLGQNPKVQEVTERGKELLEQTGVRTGSTGADTRRTGTRPAGLAGSSEPGTPQSIREVMTAAPETVGTGTTVAEAARKMREIDSGAMVVVDEQGKVSGIVTDRDIAVRAVAEGKDPSTTKVGEVASTDLVTLSPTDTVAKAVDLMRQRAVRRLPVVESGKAVGIVSIGDLAIERHPTSALADISAAPSPKK